MMMTTTMCGARGQNLCDRNEGNGPVESEDAA